MLARHVQTLARRLSSLAIGTLAFRRRSTAAFLDAPQPSPSAREGIKGGYDARGAGYEPGPQGAAPRLRPTGPSPEGAPRRAGMACD
jgi:hypothetical protein